MKCPSWMAAKVAATATIAMGMTDQSVTGTVRKSSSPVNLLAPVCGKHNRLQTTSADI